MSSHLRRLTKRWRLARNTHPDAYQALGDRLAGIISHAERLEAFHLPHGMPPWTRSSGWVAGAHQARMSAGQVSRHRTHADRSQSRQRIVRTLTFSVSADLMLLVALASVAEWVGAFVVEMWTRRLTIARTQRAGSRCRAQRRRPASGRLPAAVALGVREAGRR